MESASNYVSTAASPPSEREDEFSAFVMNGGVVEVGDWMPDGYRQALIRFMEMHANSEYMGALLERDWIESAPTLERKLGIGAKVQDEIGHAQILYCLLEDLGRPRDAVLRDLIGGRSKFHSFFHYFTESWADVGVIAWLSDAASMIAQTSLLKTSYGPYRRALQKICWEEGFHVVFGREVMEALAHGSEEQFALAQRSLDIWWPRILFFHGPPTPREDDPNIVRWALKDRPNEDLRQEFLRSYVQKIRKLELQIPDPELRWDADASIWHYTRPNWQEMLAVGRGHGPASDARISYRRRAMEENAWVHETIFARPIVPGTT